MPRSAPPRNQLLEVRNLPSGFRYADELLTHDEEAAVLSSVRSLPFHPFQFHGYEGNRRVVSFGWRYDYGARRIERAGALPEFLLGLREKAAAFAGLDPESLQQALVTEYRPGAGIGWHRDKPEFGEVIGISLLASCVFRLRRRAGSGWERHNLRLDPRSAYLLSGEVRNAFEHSIAPMRELRYSVTFRNLRE